MPKHVVVSVMSRDRVGIIAAVTKAVLELDGNIDAISQTVMRGYFTVILAADFEQEISPAEIRKKIEGSDRAGGFAVSVKERDIHAGEDGIVRDGEQFVLTIFGLDQPGIVSRITSYLSSRNINIVDLYAYTEAEQFVLVGQLMIPKDTDARQMQIDLETLGKKGNLAVNLQHENIFVATNEVDFRHEKGGN